MQRVAGLRHVATAYPKGASALRLQLRYASQRHILSSRTPTPTTPQPAAASNPMPKIHPIPLAVMIVMGGGIGFYCVQLYIAAHRLCPNPAIQNLAEQKDVSGRFDDTADGYDADVGFSELFMGIGRMRKKLAGRCMGHVLEVSCGTGRNLGYFDIGVHGKVDSLTFVDLSPQMVEICRRKWQVLFGNKANTLKQDLVIRFLPASALGNMPLAPTSPPRKYDTIIQTMGLCSTPYPVELLENMAQHLDTSNPDARIFLLEHGRSFRQWLNNILDGSAEKHAEIHGCWFNREIGALVAEAASKSNLEVVGERRHHVGTTWIFELKPKPQSPVGLDGGAAKTKSWLPWSK